jgi:hypothetical protein
MDKMTDKEHFNASMGLIENISNACEGADYFDMMFALSAVTAELITSIADELDRDATPVFLKLLKDHLSQKVEDKKLH